MCDKNCGKHRFLFFFLLVRIKSHSRWGGVSTVAGQHSYNVSMTYGTETDGKKQHIVTNKAEPAVQQTSV